MAHVNRCLLSHCRCIWLGCRNRVTRRIQGNCMPCAALDARSTGIQIHAVRSVLDPADLERLVRAGWLGLQAQSTRISHRRRKG